MKLCLSGGNAGRGNSRLRYGISRSIGKSFYDLASLGYDGS